MELLRDSFKRDLPLRWVKISHLQMKQFAQVHNFPLKYIFKKITFLYNKRNISIWGKKYFKYLLNFNYYKWKKSLKTMSYILVYYLSQKISLDFTFWDITMLASWTSVIKLLYQKFLDIKLEILSSSLHKNIEYPRLFWMGNYMCL